MQAAAVFDIGEEYEFEIIRDDDGDGSLTLSVRKIQVRFRPTFSRAPRPRKRPKLP
jgi:ribosomal protein S1